MFINHGLNQNVKLKKLSIMTYKKGQNVSIEDFSQTTSENYGVCIEDECQAQHNQILIGWSFV